MKKVNPITENQVESAFNDIEKVDEKNVSKSKFERMMRTRDKKTTILISSKTHAEFKKICDKNGVLVNTKINELIIDFIEENKK